MIAARQVLTVGDDSFTKEVMKHLKTLLNDSTLPKVTVNVDKVNKTAVLEGRESNGWIFRIVLLVFDTKRVKDSIKNSDLKTKIIQELHGRRVKQQDIALLLSVSQAHVSNVLRGIIYTDKGMKPR